jgi:hypothetical protein
MTAKKQSVASQRKAIASLKTWTDLYGKVSKAKLCKLGLVKRSYGDVVGELALLRTMVVKEQFILSPDMSVRNGLVIDRIEALQYAIKRMTPVKILVDIENNRYGMIGGVDAFRRIPNRSVRENMAGTKQLGTLPLLFTDNSECVKCGKMVGLDIPHWMGGRSSLAVCHTIPEAVGGATSNHNCTVRCAECNYREGAYIDGYILNELREITIIVPIAFTHPE